jgi:hypothetical protein
MMVAVPSGAKKENNGKKLLADGVVVDYSGGGTA